MAVIRAGAKVFELPVELIGMIADELPVLDLLSCLLIPAWRPAFTATLSFKSVDAYCNDRDQDDLPCSPGEGLELALLHHSGQPPLEIDVQRFTHRYISRATPQLRAHYLISEAGKLVDLRAASNEDVRDTFLQEATFSAVSSRVLGYVNEEPTFIRWRLLFDDTESWQYAHLRKDFEHSRDYHRGRALALDAYGHRFASLSVMYHRVELEYGWILDILEVSAGQAPALNVSISLEDWYIRWDVACWAAKLDLASCTIVSAEPALSFDDLVGQWIELKIRCVSLKSLRTVRLASLRYALKEPEDPDARAKELRLLSTGVPGRLLLFYEAVDDAYSHTRLLIKEGRTYTIKDFPGKPGRAALWRDRLYELDDGLTSTSWQAYPNGERVMIDLDIGIAESLLVDDRFLVVLNDRYSSTAFGAYIFELALVGDGESEEVEETDVSLE